MDYKLPKESIACCKPASMIRKEVSEEEGQNVFYCISREFYSYRKKLSNSAAAITKM